MTFYPHNLISSTPYTHPFKYTPIPLIIYQLDFDFSSLWDNLENFLILNLFQIIH